MLFDFRLDKLPEMRFEPVVRPFLIRPHQARVARHIGGEDRGEAAGLAHVSRHPALHRPSSMCTWSSGRHQRGQ